MRPASEILETGLPPWGEEVWFTGEAWVANKGSITTLAALASILPKVPGGHFGPTPKISTMKIEAAYTETDWTNLGYFAGEGQQYFYDTEDENNNTYQIPFSQSYIPYKFTDEQLIFRQNASIQSFDKFQEEINKRSGRALRRLNNMILGVGGLGTGIRRIAENTWDMYGLLTILNNLNDYYGIARPLSGILDSVNIDGSVVGPLGNGEFIEFLRVAQQEVTDKGEDAPVLWLMSTRMQVTVEREMYNIRGAVPGGGAIVRPTERILDSKSEPGYSFSRPNIQMYGDDWIFVFDRNIPGDGPGATNNVIIGLSPKYIRFLTVPNRFMNDPQFMHGGHTHPTSHFAVSYLWGLLWVECPPAHILIQNLEVETGEGGVE